MPDADLDFGDELYQPRAVLIVSAPDLDTGKLTRDLGLTPTDSWQEGDVADGIDEAAEQPGWVLAFQSETAEYEAEEHLSELLDLIEPKGDVLKSAIANGAHVVIDLQWTCTIDGTSNPMLSSATLGRLAALGITLDLSPTFDNDYFFGAGLGEDWEFEDEDEERPSNGKQ